MDWHIDGFRRFSSIVLWITLIWMWIGVPRSLRSRQRRIRNRNNVLGLFLSFAPCKTCRFVERTGHSSGFSIINLAELEVVSTRIPANVTLREA